MWSSAWNLYRSVRPAIGKESWLWREVSKENWNLSEQIRTYEDGNSWEQTETCDFLSRSPSSLMQVTGSRWRPLPQSLCTPGPGLRGAERGDSAQVGELKASELSCTNKVSQQISVKRYALPPCLVSCSVLHNALAATSAFQTSNKIFLGSALTWNHTGRESGETQFLLS